MLNSNQDSQQCLAVPKQFHSLTTRQVRVLKALCLDFASQQRGISRERIDAIAGASNGPQIISELRRKGFGKDDLSCRMVDVEDRDGKTCKAGRYALSDRGFVFARQMLEGHDVG